MMVYINSFSGKGPKSENCYMKLDDLTPGGDTPQTNLIKRKGSCSIKQNPTPKKLKKPEEKDVVVYTAESPKNYTAVPDER
jgi:hypothetical protein